jgi:transcriptional regulator with XRE-family HTH domain
MASLNIFLDKIKESRSLASDNALAGLLDVSRQRVSAWRHGTNHPDAVACARIADLSGVPLAQVLGVVGEARALSRDEKAVWRRLAVAAILAIATAPAMASHFVYSGLLMPIM